MNDIMSLFTSQSFEMFISSVLRQIAVSYKKEILFDAILPQDLSSKSRFRHVLFDAIAPSGFYETDGLVIFEYKYNLTPSKIASFQKALVNRLRTEKIYLEATIVIITNTICDYEFYYEDAPDLYSNIKFELWDKKVVDNWIKRYPVDYSNAINTHKLYPNAYLPNITEHNFLEKSKNNINILKNIIEYTESFALVLGAGISIDPGAKSWNDLLKYFQSALEKKGIIDNSKELCEKIGNSNIFTAQLCRELYQSDNNYFWAIHGSLYNNRKPINASYSIFQLAKIIKFCETKKHFRVLTYNFDDYLENYLDNQKVSYNTIYNSDCSIDDRVSIYHVHGFMPNVKSKSYMDPKHLKSIYLTEENYNELYNQPYSWQISSQLSFFRENTCLFVGCSLADPNIRRLLEMTKKENKTHFAILTKGSMTPTDLTIAASHFSRIGIEIIWVNDFLDITKTLQLL